VRGGEALDMIQSMLSGHSGSLSTVHANTAADALVRLETLSLMSDVEIPIYVARAQVAAALHLIVQLERYSIDGSRRVSRITEVLGLDEHNQYQMRDLYQCHLRGKDAEGQLIASLEPTGEKPTFARDPYEQGLESMVSHSEDLWSR